MEPDRPYIGWTGTLRTAAPRAQIDEVFEFVVGDCELEIVEAIPRRRGDGRSRGRAGGAGARTCRQAAVQRLSAGAPMAGSPASQPAVALRRAPEHARTRASSRRSRRSHARRPAKPAATTTRVELEKIDRVVNMVGELVIAQAMLGQIVQGLAGEVSAAGSRRSSRRSCTTPAS